MMTGGLPAVASHPIQDRFSLLSEPLLDFSREIKSAQKFQAVLISEGPAYDDVNDMIGKLMFIAQMAPDA